MTLVGAAVTTKTGQTWVAAISEFEALTGRPLPVRRCYDGAPYADISQSQAKHDLGKRKSVLSIKPSLSTPLSTLDSLASSIVAAAHPCDVIIYHEPVDNMSGGVFLDLYQRSAPPFRATGIPTGVCYTNWSANLPYSDSQSALKHYWPGDDVVDFLAIDEYPFGNDFTSMADRTRRACQFADARGVPLGLAEYGVDTTWDAAKSEKWLRSVTDWAQLRALQGRPLRWMAYFHAGPPASVGGTWWLDSKPEYVDAYTDCHRTV